MKEKIEEYERLRTKINKLHHIIGNIQLLLNSIEDSDICPFCRNKVNVRLLKEEYNRRKIEVNKLDSSIQYRSVEEEKKENFKVPYCYQDKCVSHYETPEYIKKLKEQKEQESGGQVE